MHWFFAEMKSPYLAVVENVETEMGGEIKMIDSVPGCHMTLPIRDKFGAETRVASAKIKSSGQQHNDCSCGYHTVHLCCFRLLTPEREMSMDELCSIHMPKGFENMCTTILKIRDTQGAGGNAKLLSYDLAPVFKM